MQGKLTLPDLTTAEIARVWASVGPPDENGCRDFRGGYIRDSGYAVITVRNRHYRAHRLVFLLSGGVLTPEQPLVCHWCNRRSCCEPTHLYADNHAGNLRYMFEQGRHGARTRPERVARGARVAQARLTDEFVVDARRRYAAGGVTLAALATERGVDPTTMHKAIHGKTWKHLPRPQFTQDASAAQLALFVTLWARVSGHRPAPLPDAD